MMYMVNIYNFILWAFVESLQLFAIICKIIITHYKVPCGNIYYEYPIGGNLLKILELKNQLSKLRFKISLIIQQSIAKMVKVLW
jgi:hypothetical protein